MDQLPGKRKKKLPKCANPLFVQWLTEWKDEATEKGWNSRHNYHKALVSLKKYPLPLATGKDCKMLEYFGDKICQMLDKKLSQHIAEHGGVCLITYEEPVPKKARRPTADQTSGALTTKGDLLDDIDAEKNKKTERKRKNNRAYIPVYRSAPYAIIMTLFDNHRSPHGNGHMTKAELLVEGQALADKSLSIPDPGNRYCGWSSMGSLIKRGYVTKTGSPAKYTITASGCDLAQKLLAVDNGGEAPKRPTATPPKRPTTTPSKRPTAIPPKRPTATPPKRPTTTPCKRPTTTLCHIPASRSAPPHGSVQKLQSATVVSMPTFLDQVWHDCEYSCSTSNDTTEENSSRVAADYSTTSSFACTNPRPGLQFYYVDESGREVSSKDEASVVINEELGVGFLAKAKYTDLLMCPVRYKLDNSRPSEGQYVYAHLHNDDADELSNPPRFAPSSSMTSSTITSPRAPSIAASKSTPTKKNDARPTSLTLVSPKMTLKTSKAQKSSTLEQPSATWSPPKPCSPDRRHVISSQSSTSSSSTSSSVIEQTTLYPGQYTVVLCVDNREHFGIGASKQNLLPELLKNGVTPDVRFLAVGDFLWIAKEHVAASPGQLHIPKSRELVLDWIVERKRMDDLCKSITDGRFREQKFRMRQSGLRRPTYLIEAYGSANHLGLPEDSLKQAVINSQIVDGFHIKHTRDQKETVAYLTMMTRELQRKFTNMTLMSCSRDELAGQYKRDLHINSGRPLHLLTFSEFNKLNVKNLALSVRDMFAKQLLTLSGLSQDRAAAILKQYPVPRRLFTAYQNCQTEKEQENLLTNIKFGATNRNVGAALSRQVYLLYHTAGPLK